MDAPRRLLIQSLNQDLCQLNRICSEISCSIEKNQVQSLLFPSKFSFDVAQLEIESDVKDMYVSCLEMLVDRTHYLFNLINKYVNAKYKHKNEENKYLKTASTLTLGTAASLVWENVQIIPTVISSEESSMENSNSQHTQTEEISRNRCDSCGFAVLCIKSLYRKIQNVVTELGIEADKIEKSYDITQAGYMNKITGIIENTFDKVFIDYKKQKTKSEDLEIKLNHTQNSLVKSNEELNETNAVKEKLDEDLQKLKNDYEDVVQVKNHFYHNILRKKKLMDELIEQQNQLKQENKNLNNESEKMKKETFLYSSERDFWKRRFEDLRAESERLKLESDHMKIKMRNTENEIDNCNAIFKNVENRIFKNSESFEATSNAYEELHNKIEQIYTMIANNKSETLSEMLNSNQNCKNFAGDPVKDMKREIDQNNGVIEKLSERNKKLLVLLGKFQNLRNR